MIFRLCSDKHNKKYVEHSMTPVQDSAQLNEQAICSGSLVEGLFQKIFCKENKQIKLS